MASRASKLRKAITTLTELIALTEKKLGLLKEMLRGFEYELEKEEANVSR